MSERGTEVEILSYLVDHPLASDTLEGIVEWWLLERKIATGFKTVQVDLEKLVEMGFVAIRKRAGYQETYSVITERIPQIRLWILSQTTNTLNKGEDQ